MFAKILVPLDGSKLAECALKPAFTIAQKFKSDILLVRIAMPVQSAMGLPAMTPFANDLRHANLEREAEEAGSYLINIRARWVDPEVSVRSEVLQGVPPKMIAAVANEQQIDLIVMSTHGRTGFDRLIYGSVAEAVLRGVHIPVLLVPNTF